MNLKMLSQQSHDSSASDPMISDFGGQANPARIEADAVPTPGADSESVSRANTDTNLSSAIGWSRFIGSCLNFTRVQSI